MNYTFVIGLERCGTHSVANILARSCLVPAYVQHEPPPYLCYEAYQVAAGKDWLTPELEARVRMYRAAGERLAFVCEANHRIGFVAKYLGDQLPDAKFILMVRDPIKTLVSRVATLAHWPAIIDRYPAFYQHKIKKLVPSGKDVFNTFRPLPPDLTAPLHEIYLWEWIETYRITSGQIMGRKNVMVWDTRAITNSVGKLLDFVGKEMFDPASAADEAKKRVDSVYEHTDKADTIEYAWDMFEPHMDEIKSRIRQEFPDDPTIEKITA